jgi:hypothetical protein
MAQPARRSAVEWAMKTNRFLVAGLAILASTASLFAQDTSAPTGPTPAPTDAASRKAQHRQKMLQKFDTNGDGKLDANERAAMKQAHAARIKQYDTNGDGKLDPNEKAAMRADRKAKRKAARAAAAQPTPQVAPSR